MNNLSEAQWADLDAEIEAKIAAKDAEIERLWAALNALVQAARKQDQSNFTGGLKLSLANASLVLSGRA